MAADEQLKRKRYKKVDKIGEGTYAIVYRAIDTASDTPVAIKKIKTTSSTLDISAIRELKALKALPPHPNVLLLHDVYTSKHSNLCLVLEYHATDLEMLIRDRGVVFTPGDVKSWMLMILRALEHMHQRFLIHRDLKPNNLLVSEDGQLKLADFGLTRGFGLPATSMTPTAITRWYRPPELLLGARQYGPAVDIWSAGCIFAELMLRTPFLPGETDVGQLTCILRALGTPTEADWPEMSKLPDYFPLPMHSRTPLQSLFTAASESALDLLERMLTFDPLRRATARQALEHEYFRETSPRMTLPSALPKTDPTKWAAYKAEQDRKRLGTRASAPEPRKLVF